MPKHWYNIVADLPKPPPPQLHPATHKPVTAEDLSALFPIDLIQQEISTERYIEIPEPVLEIYRQWRPSPLFRARRLEKLLDTPAHIYYKYEGISPAGSHKPNTSVPQAYYNKIQGIKKMTTETGAGQWGTSLSYACALFGMECEVWQVGASYDAKPARRQFMETFGASVHRSPSDLTECGRKLAEDPANHSGSLGIAISEAVEVAVKSPNTAYGLGSVLNHVLLHQTIIGEESLKQLAKVGEVPDLIVGCVGGGSNFAGLAFPFLREKLAGKMNPEIRAVEPSACPTLTKGEYCYDFGDASGLTPLLKMYTLGHAFVPSPIHSGGLRYHGMAPLVSHCYAEGLITAEAVSQTDCFKAASDFIRSEGILPAPEPTHALAVVIKEALECKKTGQPKVILTTLSGHGHFDLAAYDAFNTGRMQDEELSLDSLKASLAKVPVVEA
eukprot:GGOE01013614.1.p1 GENE.GGOE01013614.1~~GGOE01013614.1.p1  ORF type:complete len:465 (-),score=115.40 GGOE01013614.1:280-1605(-)